MTRVLKNNHAPFTQEINRDAKMKMEFHELVHARINSAETTLDHSRHARFYKLHDELEVVKRYRSKLREFKGVTNSRLSSRTQKQVITDFSETMLAQLDLIDHELKVFEYRYLNSIRDGVEFPIEHFESEMQSISKRFYAIQWDINSKLSHFAETVEPSSLIDRLRIFNERFKFTTTSTDNESCHGIMTRIVQRAF